MTEIWYVRGTRSADEVQREIDEFWAEFAASEQLRKEVGEAGIDPADLARLDPSTAIRTRVHGAGIGPDGVALVVAFAPIVNTAVISLWNKVILPRIRRRYGSDAIRPERPPES